MKLEKLSIILATALFLSLAVNFFMAGLMLGRSPGAPEVTQKSDWQHKDQQLRERLSERDRQVLKDVMAGAKEKFDSLRREIESARAQVKGATDSGDQEALDEALRLEKQKKMAFLRLVQETRATAAESVSPEGREILQKMGAGGHGRRGGRGWMGDLPPDIGGPDDPEWGFMPY